MVAMQFLDHFIAFALIGIAIAQAGPLPEELKTMPATTLYRVALITGLAVGGAILLWWLASGRGWSLLGLAARPTGELSIYALAWVALLALLVTLGLRTRAAAWLTPFYGKYSFLMPKSRGQLAFAWVVSVSAGFWEELAYRAFLLFYLSAFLGEGWAVAVSSLIFGLTHGYQGWRGIIGTALAGALLAAIYLATGSLLLVMWMHATYDIATFSLGYRLLKNKSNSP